jgi:hypothetical protein
VREGANAHAEAIAAREALLQFKVEAAEEVQRVKTAMARQVEKDMAAPKELEAAQQKAKDAADDLHAIVDDTFDRPLSLGFLWLALFLVSTLNVSRHQ